jgi:hypothetical protein
MTKAGSIGRPNGPAAARRKARGQRLAAALKANLRRRKAQARERAVEAEGPSPGADLARSHDSAAVVADKQSD